MGKVKIKKAKRALKTSKLIAASLLAAISKKKRIKIKGANNKHAASAAAALEGDPGAYGVVPCEYNIQAQIDWLTAPPSTVTEKKTSNHHVLPPPSKKPQRGYHRDICEACGEGDYLMYCDKCPSAYHAICDDPPLPPEDYETLGINWKCKKCRCLSEQDNESQKSVENSSSSGERPVSKFFQQFLPHYQTQNPTQFKLSKEMPAYDYPFPGTSRHIIKKGRHRTNVVDIENGMVPRPTVLCYHCHKSCRTGALIQCDKCDLFFHLDCLDPPLTTIPATVWMCPLHVEPYLESTQLTTIALSERIKIWDSTEKPVNRSAVIVNFLRKASRRNPMFRRKKLIPMTLTPEIPEMVQNCYKNEGSMYVHEKFGKMQTLAAACEVERLKVEMEENVNKYKNRWIDHYLPLGNALVDQRAQVEFLRNRNESKLDHIRHVMKTCEEMEERKGTQNNEEVNSAAATQKSQKGKVSQILENFPNGTEMNSETSQNGSRDQTVTKRPSQDGATTEEDKSAISSDILPKTEITDDAVTSASTSTADGQIHEPEDDEAEKTAKWLRDEIEAAKTEVEKDSKDINELSRDVRRVGEMLLRFPITDEYINRLASKNVVDDVSPPLVTAPITSSLPSSQPILPASSLLESVPSLPSIYTPKEHVGLPIDVVRSLPKKTIHKLAACHLRNIKRKQEIKEFVQSEKLVQSISAPKSLPGPRPLIAFYIENICVNVEITKRSFWIGSGDNCDWKLTDFVKCNRIDEKHAKIFYNPREECWEILNYSPHGIYVNNTLFGFKSQDAHVEPSNSILERMQEIQEINSKRVDDYIKAHNAELYNIDMTPCFCKPFPTKAMANVFEGSARIYPGHRMQIGCAKLTIDRVTLIE